MSNTHKFKKMIVIKSLSSKLLVLTIIWLLLAMTAIGYTLLLSWKLEGGAAAINDAGSLRMRSYRMALLVNTQAGSRIIEQEEHSFEETMTRLQRGDPSRPLFLPDNREVREQAASILSQWQKNVLPKIHSTQHATPYQSTIQLTDIALFVDSIDHLVNLIEQDIASNTKLLRLFQMALIVFAMAGAITMMYLLFLLIIRPLRTLGRGIEQIGDAQLSARVPVIGNDEFSLLSIGFNQMATRLQELYTTLEDKVMEKTQSLDEKNHQLGMLYSITAFLHGSHELESMCKAFIERLMQLSRADAASIRLIDSTRGKLEPIAQIGLSEEMKQSYECTHINACYCGDSLKQANTTTQVLQSLDQLEQKYCMRHGFHSLSNFHINAGSDELGIFTLFFRQPCPLSTPQQRLVETLVSHLGVAIQNLRLGARDRQFAVSEERNLMAQGLHDSIAQSLSFLNLQVQMLESELATLGNPAAQENLAFIKAGIQECYDDVRELLLNFRTRISKEDFPLAINTLLQRFEQQTGVVTQFHMQGEGLPLNPEQQLQVIFILQEALSNVRKHAQAQQVSISLDNHADFVMRISDDGTGFSQDHLEARKTQHVGLSIMQERAKRIQAHIQIDTTLDKGTVVTLTLPAAERRAS